MTEPSEIRPGDRVMLRGKLGRGLVHDAYLIRRSPMIGPHSGARQLEYPEGPTARGQMPLPWGRHSTNWSLGHA